ncbi:N-acetylmannosamine-6-phosphate 2-epimerase [Heyndrickxia sporothermodurans]|uniref:N-acetylmannosamine-6-phosphate 2-epimerase n=1 Tax=Heyndrickxia sporothermodurans TaxID=46224 RepID=UPI0035E1CB7E
MTNNKRKQTLLDQIENGLIVSCQARKGWPMYGSNIMAAFAKAASEGGAVGIRANEPQNIIAIKNTVDLPIIGLYKQWHSDYEVYITPTFESAVEVIQAGADIVAIDGTARKRPNNETFPTIVQKLKAEYPNVLIMADISTLEEAKDAERIGVDLISTTLSGYTEQTKHIENADFTLLEKLVQLHTPIVAEGRIHTQQEAKKALELGVHSVVVGTAITRPEVITRWFVEEIKSIS